MSEGRFQIRGVPGIVAALATGKKRKEQQNLAAEVDKAERERKNIKELISFQKIIDSEDASAQMKDFARQGIANIGPTGGQQQSTPPLTPPAPRVSPRATFRPQPGTGPRLPIGGARSPSQIASAGQIRQQGIKADVAVADKRRKATEQSALRKFRSLAGSRFKQLFPKKSLFDAFFAKELGEDAKIQTFSFKNKVHGPLLLKAIEELKALGIPVSDLEIADLQLEEFRGPSQNLSEVPPVSPGLSRTGTELDSALGFLPTDTVGASFTEGATATDSAGQKIVFRNGKWVPLR